MMLTPPEKKSPVAARDLESCDAMLIALASGRIVVVRRDSPIRICSAERLCKPVRQLRRGEPVYCDGRQDRVRALLVY
ncbi:hypothetical protein FYK55_00255 [Roseiconus nitratireducens]|uniref:Uncharacterized protein n=1 Tax=Roseiconus nitratireducens TaxID=2605748 RepID=A0A5M6DKY8_9BACT|nr:hypothetical protein [Roseiconus nitratireducens]KAA5546899.1 hypothetical protein FYK55_00255 [Roseiconus nitratireducens]